QIYFHYLCACNLHPLRISLSLHDALPISGFFASSWLPAARRVAIVSDSGGQGAIAADTAEGFSLSVEILDPATAEKAAAHLPESGGVGNPLDLDGAGGEDLCVDSRLGDVLGAG